MIHVTRDSKLPDEFTLVRIRNIASEVFSKRDYDGDASLIFTNNKTIQKLNSEYRNLDVATDVLSFPSEEINPETGVRYLGDVIISIEKAYSQSLQADKPFIDELTMLIVHGCLHLTGLDHATESDKKIMKTHQEFLLRKLGVKNSSWPEDD
jgi:probable rRNA maturation factor